MTPTFRSKDDERRYQEFFSGEQRWWRLKPNERTAAKLIFGMSPTLERNPYVLTSRGLDMQEIPLLVEDYPELRTAFAAALSVITIPNLACAYFGDVTWSKVLDEVTPGDLAAFAAAAAVRR